MSSTTVITKVRAGGGVGGCRGGRGGRLEPFVGVGERGVGGVAGLGNMWVWGSGVGVWWG